MSCINRHLQLQKCPRHSFQVVPMAPSQQQYVQKTYRLCHYRLCHSSRQCNIPTKMSRPKTTTWSSINSATLGQFIRWHRSFTHQPSRYGHPWVTGKWTTGYQLLKRKVRAALRGGLMLPYVYYDLVYHCAPMASTATVRLLLWVKAHIAINMGPLRHYYGLSPGSLWIR